MKIFRICLLISFLLSFYSSFVFGQDTYFDQDFAGPGPFASTTPNLSQFDTLLTTAPEFSTFNFANGEMEMKRVDNPSTGGKSGLARAVRNTPFSPNPETLYIQITLYAKDLDNLVSAPNGMYFYVGEGFSNINSSIPSNSLLFAKISLSFSGTSFVVRDLSTNQNSVSIQNLQPITITWVLNNSDNTVAYKFPESSSNANNIVGSMKYDVWVDNNLLADEVGAYPLPNTGDNPFSTTKLSNFEIRYTNGFGSIVFTNIKIRNIDGVLPITIHDLKTEKINKGINLAWALGGVWDDTYFFQVQRSKDGISFESIGSVPVNKLNSRYEFIEEFTPVGNWYYRIDGLNSDGIPIAKSKLVLVQGETDVLVSNISPNPVENNFFVLNETETTTHYKVYNSTGSEVPMQSKNDGSTKVGFYSIMPLKAGYYVLEYQRGNSIIRKKVVVR